MSLVCAQAADAHGNLFTGPNTEDTPAIVEATAFKSGIVIAQVNELVETVARVDIPGDSVESSAMAICSVAGPKISMDTPSRWWAPPWQLGVELALAQARVVLNTWCAQGTPAGDDGSHGLLR